MVNWLVYEVGEALDGYIGSFLYWRNGGFSTGWREEEGKIVLWMIAFLAFRIGVIMKL